MFYKLTQYDVTYKNNRMDVQVHDCQEFTTREQLMFAMLRINLEWIDFTLEVRNPGDHTWRKASLREIAEVSLLA